MGRQAANDSVRLADVAVLIQTTKITEVLRAIIKLPLVPRDEEYQFRRRSTDLLQKWNELIGPNDKNQAPTSASFAIRNEGENQSGPISAQVPSIPPTAMGEKKDQNSSTSVQTSMKGVEKNMGAVVISRLQTKSPAVNEPSVRTRISVGKEASASRYPDVFGNPKSYVNINPNAKREHYARCVPASTNPRGWAMDIRAEAFGYGAIKEPFFSSRANSCCFFFLPSVSRAAVYCMTLVIHHVLRLLVNT